MGAPLSRKSIVLDIANKFAHCAQHFVHHPGRSVRSVSGEHKVGVGWNHRPIKNGPQLNNGM